MKSLTRSSIWKWILVLICALFPDIQLVSSVTQYHEQGLHGHHSYKYGFDTGDHYNPQQRYEEADGWGNVKGSFSYMDGTGHKVTVHYRAGKNGFFRSDDPANHNKGHHGHHQAPPVGHGLSRHHHHNQHHHGHHHFSPLPPPPPIPNHHRPHNHPNHHHHPNHHQQHRPKHFSFH